jgi:hypothetical protein
MTLCKDHLRTTLAMAGLFIAIGGFTSCYKLKEEFISYEDGRSTVMHDLPGDTLASDGWDDNFQPGDTYMRQSYYSSTWTDSIRIVPWDNEKINAAAHVDSNGESGIVWRGTQASHPQAPGENDAYTNTSDGNAYIYRSGAWYQMNIEGDKGVAKNDSIFISWRGAVQSPPPQPEVNWAYCDLDNHLIYIYTGKAWALMVNDANYRSNIDFVKVQYSKSGKETGNYSIFLFRFSDGSQQFVRDGADSARYLPTDKWDIAFTDNFNSVLWLNNASYDHNPGYGGPMTKTSLLMYAYGYDFMDQAPSDSLFDAVPAHDMQMGYASEYGAGVNAWYEYSNTTHIAQPFPYRACYLRLQQIDPSSGKTSYRYGKLQVISMYKGAPEVVTDLHWPSPYFTFRYFIQQDGSHNLKTKS